MDLSNLPVVDYSRDRAVEYLHLARLGPQLAAYRPEGFRCSVHEDVAERLKEEHCGGWFAELGYEPFPVGFYTQNGHKVSWHIFRAPDGLWRPMPGVLCGFTLTDAQVELLVAQKGLRVALDRQTGWPCLVDVDGEAPVLSRDDWSGECSGCGLCCFSPRVGTGAPCAKLVAGRVQVR